MEHFSTELWEANSTWSPIVPSSCSRDPSRNSCLMTQDQNAKRDVIAFTRSIVSILSIIGALSIIISVSVKKQVCSPKIHPIFMLSIADCLLAILWVVGGAMWLQGNTSNVNAERVGCFTVLLMTVILECITTNLTLVYALLAYSGIKRWDFNNVYTFYRQQDTGHVWNVYKTATAYTVAWLLPVILIMTPFGIIAAVHHIVKQANTCSCWCLPYFGNVVPLSWPGDKPTAVYLYHMRMFIASYGVIVGFHYIIVFTLLVFIYWKILRKIRQMRVVQEQNKTTQNLYGATEAFIIRGQSQAKSRVICFLTNFVIVGFFNMCLSFAFTVFEFIHLTEKDILQDLSMFEHSPPALPFTLYILQSITVPLQGFLNAIVYGWTREDFVSVLYKNKPLQPNAINDCEDDDDTFVNSEEVQRSRAEYSYSNTLDTGRGYSQHTPRRDYLFTVSEEIEDRNEMYN